MGLFSGMTKRSTARSRAKSAEARADKWKWKAVIASGVLAFLAYIASRLLPKRKERSKDEETNASPRRGAPSG